MNFLIILFYQNKCTKYWPDRSEPMKIEHCTISLVEEIKYAFFVVRKLSVQKVNVSFFLVRTTRIFIYIL